MRLATSAATYSPRGYELELSQEHISSSSHLIKFDFVSTVITAPSCSALAISYPFSSPTPFVAMKQEIRSIRAWAVLVWLFDAESFLVPRDADFADVATGYSEFISRLLALTARPTAKLLAEAMILAWPDMP